MKENINQLILNFPLPKEQLISVIFSSFDQNIHCSVICKKTDTFSTIESLFYQKYSEFKRAKKIFICNGNEVDVSRNLEENNIRNSDIITLKTVK